MMPIPRTPRLPRALLLPVLLHLLTVMASCDSGGASPAPTAGPRVTRFRITPAPGEIFGPLRVTVDGVEKQIAEDAVKAWLIQDGLQVAYSGLDGSGGYENEGQSLRVWNAGTGEVKRLLSEYSLVANVREATSSRGEPAWIVELEEGMTGAPHVAVVDPGRGEVFIQKWASLVSVQDGRLHMNLYRQEDWDIRQDEPDARIEPRDKAVRDLHELLKGSVIVNPELR